MNPSVLDFPAVNMHVRSFNHLGSCTIRVSVVWYLHANCEANVVQ